MQHAASAAAKASSKSILSHSKRPHCTKTVSFCRDEEYRVYRADDYDRTPVEPSRDLSTRDYQELEEVILSSTASRQRVVGGRVNMGVVPLLQDDSHRSPPSPVPAAQTRFPSTPSRFTSFNFVPLIPDGTTPGEQRTPPPSPPRRQAPARSFPGFSFVSVVPVTDPPPPPPPVPQSRPTNFLPLTPVVSPMTSSVTPASPTVSFKRDPLTRPRSAAPPAPAQATPISIPTPQASLNAYRPRNSPPNASPPGRRDYRPTSSPTFCAPIAPAGPQSPRSSLLHSFAS